MRLNLHSIIWWWHFTWIERWRPLSRVKLGWSVKISSVHDDELGSKWVGSETGCCKPWTIVTDSIFVPSWDVTSSGHHDLDLALKLPSIIVKEGLNCLIWFRSLSKLDKNFSNSIMGWLGDWYVKTT